jgi:FlaG/FlaF family flagellin (archaellin)
MLYKVCSLVVLARIGTVAVTFVLPGVMVGFCVGKCSREAGHSPPVAGSGRHAPAADPAKA